jgi:cytidyltransferase-like protein
MTIADRLQALGRADRFRRAYIGGTFDCLHRGHLALFAAARQIARELVVSVNTDAFAARYKRRPLMPLADRLAVLGCCRLVDDVVVNAGDEDSRPAILHSQADCVVHGSDWVGGSLLVQMGLTETWLETHAIRLVILPYTPWTSTTQLLEAYDRRTGVQTSAQVAEVGG